MQENGTIAVIGTFDTKGEEHKFIKERILERRFSALTINLGTGAAPPYPVDIDLYERLTKDRLTACGDRDRRIQTMIRLGRQTVQTLHGQNRIHGLIAAGGGTGTYLCSQVMRALPMGVPKMMVSTVASRDMSAIVGTGDLTVTHSVTDILGINSITGAVLDRAAAAVCAMAGSRWQAARERSRIALSFFGFITPAAEQIRQALQARGYEVVPFHANGTGGMAMMKLAGEGFFQGILDLATHELADAMKGGYCGGIGPRRFAPAAGRPLPRLIVPGGLDCAVLEFTRDNVPDEYKDRSIFFYDFRSAVRLSKNESLLLAEQLAQKLNLDPNNVRLLIPTLGFSEADRPNAPLYAPSTGRALIERLKQTLDPSITVKEADLHINDPAFAVQAADMMVDMLGTEK